MHHRNLSTINGDRLFILVAAPPNAAELRGESLKSDRSSHRAITPKTPSRNPAGTSRPRDLSV
ncbi:MAG TPA: hypothetical protein V6C57_26785 [Coleofasciculaceae cyanobacterium]